jgi:hypothetical protein
VNQFEGAVGRWEGHGFVIRLNPDDAELRCIWEAMVALGYDKTVFYDGGVLDFQDFWCFARSDANRFFALRYNGQTEAIAWLNGYEGRSSRVHFSSLVQGLGALKRAVEHGRHFCAYAFSHPNVWTLTGVTPAHYTWALRYITRVGLKVLGTIPDAYQDLSGVSRDIVISYINRRDI